MSLEKTFARFANVVSHAAGRPPTFAVCLLLVIAWAVTGPAFGFSETWQLVINTGTTIATFLMVFLIQNTQNRDNAAIQAKLDDLILTSDAEDMFVGIERMTDKELEDLRRKCEARARAHVDAHQRLEKELARREAPARKRGGGQLRKARGAARPGRRAA